MKTLRALQAPALLFLLCSLFYWKLTLTNEYTWLDSPDLAHQVLPWYQFQASEFHQGRFPLWDPYHWNGQPLIGQAQPGTAYPLNWILFKLPLKNGWIRQVYMHWYFVFIHFMAALFCYLLCRDLARSRGSSVIAGCAFGLGGYMGSIDWPMMLNGAVWAPLVLLFLLRVARGVRPMLSAPLAGAMLGMAFLSGHHQVPIFITLMSGAIWLYLILRSGRIDWKLARLVVSFGALMFLVSALQLLPAMEYGKLAKRWVGVEDPVGWDQKVPYLMHNQFANRPISVLETITPGLTPGTNSFFGIVAVSLAIAAFILLRRKHGVPMLGAVALGGLLYSIAPFVTFQGMLYALLPMVEKARSPSMAIVLFHLGCAGLLAFALDSKQVRAWRPLHWALLCLPVVIYAMVIGFVFAGKINMDERQLMTPLAALLACALLALWRRGEMRASFAKAGLLFLLLMELGNVSTYNYGSTYLKNGRDVFLPHLAANADIFEYLHHLPRPFRVDIDSSVLPANMGDWHGIETVNGYLASLTANVQRLGGNEEKKLDLFAVDIAVRKESNRPGQIELFKGRSGLKVFRNTTAMPRAWTVHSARQIAQVEIAVNPRGEALFLEPAPKLEACPGDDRVEWIFRRPSSIAMRAETHCRALLIVADTYYPGWKATVDGIPAPILEVDGALRGVVLDAGTHRIEMHYRPLSVIAGAALTSLGFLLTIALLILSARKNAPPAARA